MKMALRVCLAEAVTEAARALRGESGATKLLPGNRAQNLNVQLPPLCVVSVSVGALSRLILRIHQQDVSQGSGFLAL